MIVAIVLHFRREAFTAACVESLLAQQPAPRVLIVDNASGDGSLERLRARFPHVDILETGANLGYAGGNNRGIAWALAQGATQLLVINDDAELTSGALAALAAALASDPQAALASPTIVHDGPERRIWWAGGRWDPWRVSGHHEQYGRPLAEVALPALPRPTDCVTGCCLLLRADVVQRDGAFREDFLSYVEDLELSLRYRRRGWRLLLVPAALAVHKVAYPEGPATPWKIVRRDRNRRAVARAYLSPPRRWGFAMLFAVTRAARLAQYALRGDWARARAIVAGLRDDPPGAAPRLEAKADTPAPPQATAGGGAG